MRTARLLLCLSVAFAAAGSAQPPEPRAFPPSVSRFTSETLTRFESEAEFVAYLEALDADAQDRFGRRPDGILVAQAPSAVGGAASEVQSDAPPDPVEPTDPICDDPDFCPMLEGDTVTVTGTVRRTNPSITNNQMRGVDEGDIVKQIGQYLIVLQDGRLFAIDTRPGGRPGMALADRIDVYRGPGSATWYDEMLVQGDRIVVAAFSYREAASELSVFRLGEDGRFHREGVFLISSNDYYSANNYATRLVGDSLVVYTPFALHRWSGFRARGRLRWPTVRRWLPPAERRAAAAARTPLFDGREVYRPVRDTLMPTLHAISVCPLGPLEAGRDLSCRTTAFVGLQSAQLYVTSSHAYLWINGRQDEGRGGVPGRCRSREWNSLGDIQPASAYRVRVGDGLLEVLAARGQPIDQFSFEANETRFRALLRLDPIGCWPYSASGPSLAFLDMPLSAFGQRVREVSDRLYTALPSTQTNAIANRFTDRYLVYGGLAERDGPNTEDEPAVPPAFVVPVERPEDVRRLPLRHNVQRAERAGDDIVLTGYRDRSGLRISLIDLARRPRVASTVHLPGRFESEGRSHAFNSLIEPDGSGIMGIPTVAERNLRHAWRSDASDVSFLTADAQGRLSSVGLLAGEDGQRNPSYRCEVSCIDWYGNSRPIFTDGRIFALAGTDLVEGRLAHGRIGEIGRLDLTAPPPTRR